MERRLCTFILLLVVSAALTSIASAMTDAECATATLNCQKIANDSLYNSSATNQQKCQKVQESLTCLKKLDSDCVTEIKFRLMFLMAKDKVKNMSLTCDLDSQSYPPITPSADPCPQGTRDCLFQYVDQVLQRDADPDKSDLRYGLCQDLTEYVGCRLNKNCTSKQTLTKTVSQEETRMKVDCVVPPLTTSYTFTECGMAIAQCNTLRDNSQEDVCPSYAASLNCTVSLGCANDILLRLIKLEAFDTLKAMKKNCDREIVSAFAEVERTTNACQAGLRKCVNDYVDILRNKSSSTPKPTGTELCKELDKFFDCENKVNGTCKASASELKELRADEIARMKIEGSCSSNHGIKTSSTLTISSMIFLCFLVTIFKDLM